MPNLGVPELLIILVIVVIFFGVGRLPELGGALGRSIREFRKATAEEETPVIEDKEA
nr:twin-arginine translocase TatA/TatE family subunit [Ardenticatena sp.]